MKKLSKRQSEIHTMLLAGLTMAQMSVELGLTIPSIKKHVELTYSKLGIKTRRDLANIELDETKLPVKLTRQQMHVLKGIVAGKTFKQIGIEMDISVRTVHNHRYKIYQKMGVGTRPQIIAMIIKNELGISKAEEDHDQNSTSGEITKEAPSIEPQEAVRRMLTRIPPSDGQIAVYTALANGKLEYKELLKHSGRTRAEMAGLFGALGKRIKYTKDIHEAGLPGNINAILTEKKEGDKHYIFLHSYTLEALKAEHII